MAGAQFPYSEILELPDASARLVDAGDVEIHLALGWQLTAPIGESVAMIPPPEFRVCRDD